MEKYFLFRKEEINESSSRASDTGVGLSVLAVPVKHVSFLTASKGAVNITFNDAGLYEKIELFDSEAIEKTAVTVSCIVGQELELLENIINFISISSKNILKFDVVSEESSFKTAVLSEAKSISSVLRVNPTVVATGEISTGTPEKEHQGAIGEIYFGDNLPSLDFNHEGLSGYSNHDEITAWSNAGTGGNTYSIAANVGDPLAVTNSVEISKTGVSNAFDDYLIVPNAYTVSDDYTLYVVFNTTSTKQLGVMYGDAAGETMGFCFGSLLRYDASGGIDKASTATSTFTARHGGRSGAPASVNTRNKNDGTEFFGFPDNYIEPTTGETCHVFVVRRDHKFNMFLHNRDGKLVGFIPSYIQADTSDGKLTSSDNMTDGDLLIEQIGSGGGIVATVGQSKSFVGVIARFGVIERDIGANAAANLANDLFKLYNF